MPNIIDHDEITSGSVQIDFDLLRLRNVATPAPRTTSTSQRAVRLKPSSKGMEWIASSPASYRIWLQNIKELGCREMMVCDEGMSSTLTITMIDEPVIANLSQLCSGSTPIRASRVSIFDQQLEVLAFRRSVQKLKKFRALPATCKTKRSLKDLFENLDGFSALKDRWDGYEAPRPNDSAIRTARTFLSVLEDSELVPSRLKPSVIGGVGVTFKKEKRKAYVEFYNNGTVYVLFSGRGEPTTQQIKPTSFHFDQLVETIQDFLNA